MDSSASPATGSRRTADVDGHPTASSSADDFGKITHDNGNRYEGELKDGKRHGRGKITYACGDEYDGDWEDDKIHGQGKYTWVSGSVYVGEYKDDSRHGKGRQTWANGDAHEGGWEDGKIHGQGKTTYANGDYTSGSVYDGEWMDDARHGTGTITWGKLTYANGDVYVGEWKEGKQPEIERRVEDFIRLEELQEKIQGIPRHCPRLRESHFFNGACEHSGVTLEIVECLLDAFPDAARSMDRKGRSPLHYACMNKNQDPGIVQLLLDRWPESVNRQDIDGNVPLHWLCGSSSVDGTASLAILNLLLQKIPEVRGFLDAQLAYARVAEDNGAVRTQDENGWLPLHLALRKHASLGAIKLLCRANRDALQVSDNPFAAFPLHIACGFSPVGVVEYLLGLSDNHLHALDLERDSTLHYACRGGNVGVVKCLLGRGVPSVSEPNDDGKLPIQLLWESGRVDRNSVEYVEAVWRLLLARPETVMHRSKDALI
ncbi:hypothetical protein ACHAXT_012821 [Thalassiosira profunda]